MKQVDKGRELYTSVFSSAKSNAANETQLDGYTEAIGSYDKLRKIKKKKRQ